MLKPIVLHKTNLSGFIVFIMDMIFLFFNRKMIVLHASLYSNGFCLADQKAEGNVYIIYNVFYFGLVRDDFKFYQYISCMRYL